MKYKNKYALKKNLFFNKSNETKILEIITSIEENTDDTSSIQTEISENVKLIFIKIRYHKPNESQYEIENSILDIIFKKGNIKLIVHTLIQILTNEFSPELLKIVDDKFKTLYIFNINSENLNERKKILKEILTASDDVNFTIIKNFILEKLHFYSKTYLHDQEIYTGLKKFVEEQEQK
jgi:hypothetical protein